MLRKASNVTWERSIGHGWAFWRTAQVLKVGGHPLGGFYQRDFKAMNVEQIDRPVFLIRARGRSYWWYANSIYWEDEGLGADDIYALVESRVRGQQRRLERAHAVVSRDEPLVGVRAPIPREVRLAVFQRYAGRCAECESAFDLQYDHIIPVALGGGNSVENLQLLCGSCNRAKGSSLG